MMTLLAFVVTLGILIAVHEYGHYQVARWCGVKVLRFSIGFGKPLISRTIGKDQTEYVLAALPFGGYVKMLDEREAPVPSEDQHRAFNRQPVWKRILIVSAGPAANLLLAIILYWVLFMHGVMGMRPVIGEVVPNSPAAAAHLKTGQLIKTIADNPVTTWQDVRWELLQQSMKHQHVEIETIAGNDLYLYRLSLADLAKDDFQGDFLEKLGLQPYRPDMPAKVGEIVKGSVAEKAGLKIGDRILQVNDRLVDQWEDFVALIRSQPGVALQLQVNRQGEILTIPVVPETQQNNGETIGRIGAGYRMKDSELDALLVEVKYTPLDAIAKAAEKTWETSIFSLKMLGSMIAGEASWKGLSGPVTIASYAGQSAHIGLKAFIGFLALLSISLGVLNLLPIPVLDGGHLLYYMIEIIKGSPVSEKVMEAGQRIGFVVLGLLMACAFYNDINRLITG